MTTPERLSDAWFCRCADGIDERLTREENEWAEIGLTWSSKEDYLKWRDAWKSTYRMMTADARRMVEQDIMRWDATERKWVSVGKEMVKSPTFGRHQRRGMMKLRAEGKVRSWAARCARLAEQTK